MPHMTGNVAGRSELVRQKAVPVWVALLVSVLGGACASTQAAVNAELGVQLGSALSAAAISNTCGGLLFLIAVSCVRRVRVGVKRIRHAAMPWWMFCGGVFGAIFVFAGSYAVPVVGVAVFTVAQVCGNTAGGLGTDAVGLGPTGKLRASLPRMLGVVLAITAVCVAQIGRTVGLSHWWLVPVIVCVGAGIALQGALNGRVNEVTGNPVSTGLINFMVGTVVLYVVVTMVGVLGGLPALDLPWQPWLYLGGPLGSVLIIATMIAIGVIGVLRMSLAILTGQLAGALVLDLVITGQWPTTWVVCAVVLTAAAVLVAGMRGRRAVTVATEPEPVTAARHEDPDAQ